MWLSLLLIYSQQKMILQSKKFFSHSEIDICRQISFFSTVSILSVSTERYRLNWYNNGIKTFVNIFYLSARKNIFLFRQLFNKMLCNNFNGFNLRFTVSLNVYSLLCFSDLSCKFTWEGSPPDIQFDWRMSQPLNDWIHWCFLIHWIKVML